MSTALIFLEKNIDNIRIFSLLAKPSVFFTLFKQIEKIYFAEIILLDLLVLVDVEGNEGEHS